MPSGERLDCTELKNAEGHAFQPVVPVTIAERPHGPVQCARALVEDASQRKEATALHHIDIECTHYTATGARYRVDYQGETLIESAGDPEYQACRALLALGIVGTLVTYRPGSAVQSGRIDIEAGAKLMTVDTDKKGPRTARYRPHPGRVDPTDPK